MKWSDEPRKLTIAVGVALYIAILFGGLIGGFFLGLNLGENFSSLLVTIVAFVLLSLSIISISNFTKRSADHGCSFLMIATIGFLFFATRQQRLASGFATGSLIAYWVHLLIEAIIQKFEKRSA